MMIYKIIYKKIYDIRYKKIYYILNIIFYRKNLSKKSAQGLHKTTSRKTYVAPQGRTRKSIEKSLMQGLVHHKGFNFIWSLVHHKAPHKDRKASAANHLRIMICQTTFAFSIVFSKIRTAVYVCVSMYFCMCIYIYVYKYIYTYLRI